MESSVIFFPCQNLEETLRFYTQVLGLTLFHRDPAGSILLDSGYGYLGFCQYGDGRPMASGICISFNLKDERTVDEKYRDLLAMGTVQGLTAPKKHPVFSVYSFFLQDPNGYPVEFQKILQ